MAALTSDNTVSASDPRSALALQRLVQAAVWFLGENANYAASEYAWESATHPCTALMMLDADKMVAEASSRNPTLAGALTRVQRCTFIGSWEVRIIAAQALTTMAIRSGEPFRLQICEFLHAVAQGGMQPQFSEMHLSNGGDQGSSGTGLGVLISPMLKVLHEMYSAQDELIKDIGYHDNAKKEWSDEELEKLYETHERLLDFVSLFCFVPRAKYLSLGPISIKPTKANGWFWPFCMVWRVSSECGFGIVLQMQQKGSWLHQNEYFRRWVAPSPRLTPSPPSPSAAVVANHSTTPSETWATLSGAEVLRSDTNEESCKSTEIE